MTTENYIKIYSPATIANMGPGFDCIGGAIDIWNEFEFLFQPRKYNTSKLKIEIKGEGEAKAVDIYAKAFSKDPEFYEFYRSLEAYKKIIDKKTTLVLPSNSNLFETLNK